MQGNLAQAVAFFAGHFAAVQPARTEDANALRPQLHRPRDGLTHGAFVGNTLGNLLGNALGNKLGVQFRVADFVDVRLERLLELVFQNRPQLVHAFAAAPDDNAGFSRVQGDFDTIGRPFNFNTRNGGVRQRFTVLDECADMDIFHQCFGVAFVQVPFAFPVPIHADAEPDGMDFLSHKLFSLFPFLIRAIARVRRTVTDIFLRRIRGRHRRGFRHRLGRLSNRLGGRRRALAGFGRIRRVAR